MDHPILSPITPRLAAPRAHMRNPSRSPTRTRLTDDLLSDLSPATTLEAFTNPSGKLRASIEAASPVERAFGMRATLASNKIQEWMDELSAWSWPTDDTSAGFAMPAAKRRRISVNGYSEVASRFSRSERQDDTEYMGILTVQEVIDYETRIEEITEDMEELNVDEIKRQVLDTHFSPRSRPSSSASNAPMPSLFASYTKMDDFTAVITATVLQSLPNLSKLMRLMDTWSVRLVVLRKIPPLLLALDDVNIALKSGWAVLDVAKSQQTGEPGEALQLQTLSRQSFEIIRDVLQDKVTTLGQELDFMLDTLEGRQDTLPEQWLDRMEAIEQNYGEWVVAADRKVREGEWARMANARKEAEETLNVKEKQEAEAARHDAESMSKKEQDNESSSRAVTEKALAVEQQVGQSKISNTQLASGDTEDEAQEAAQGGGDPSTSIETLAHSTQQHLEPRTNIISELTALPPEVSGSKPAKAAALPETTELFLKTTGVWGVIGSGAKLLSTSNPDDDSQTTANPELEPLLRLPTELALSDGNSSVADANPTPQKAEGSSTLSSGEANNAAKANPVSISGLHGGKDRSPANELYLHNLGSLPPTAENLNSSPLGTQSTDVVITCSSIGSSHYDQIDHHDARIAAQVPTAHTVIHRPVGTPPSISVSAPGNNVASQMPIQDVLSPTAATRTAEEPDSVTLDARTRSARTQIPDKRISLVNPLENRLMEPEIPLSQNPSLESKTKPGGHDKVESAGPSIFLSDGHVSGYSTSDTTPLVFDAEPATYFSSVLTSLSSPSKALRSPSDGFESPETPTRSRPKLANKSKIAEKIYTPSDSKASPVGPEHPSGPLSEVYSPADLSMKHFIIRSGTTPEAQDTAVSGNDGSYESLPTNFEMDDCTSAQQIADDESDEPSPIENQGLETAFGLSTSSQASTTVTRSGDDPMPSSPFPVSSPLSESEALDSFSETEEPSPTAGRLGQRNKHSHDYSPPDSPTMPAISKFKSIEPSAYHNFSRVESNNPQGISILDAPLLENVEVSEAPIVSSPKKAGAEQSTDDQIQQQISNILESIPARIVLTTEPDSLASSNEMLQPKKSRRPVIPSYRSHSSLSAYSLASTPSFTLAPAYGKGISRPRPQNGNPEIKLYHLSRSTGEAPIKLFVRLVGEHGERVMVRVGGGWADLGEYLREYASHHGRRSVNGENDRVEVHSIAPRTVSSSSTASSATVRGGYSNGRSSPVSRPASAFDRPISSLAVRRTRQSFTNDNDFYVSAPRPRDHRSPSTPLPLPLHHKTGPTSTIETPPSASSVLTHSASRSSSRLSWTEEDSSLGLAGPKSRKAVISDKDQEWVESVKEKVRLASAEKEKEREREKAGKAKGLVSRERIASFGELEKVGATKRLFRKG